MEEPPLASLSLTHVYYVSVIPVGQRQGADSVFQNPNDSLSYLSAWLALVPQALCVIYVTLIWASREMEIVMMFVGQMGCEAFNFLLKRWIKEERPRRTCAEAKSSPFHFGLHRSRNVWERLWHALIPFAVRGFFLGFS